METLSQSTVQMHEGMTNGLKTTEEVIKKYKRKNYEGMEADLLNVKNGFIKHKKLAEEMKNEVTKCQEEQMDDRKRISRLEDVFKKLQPQVDNLMKKNKNLEIARITSNFEYGLAAYIYPPETKITFSPIFPSLMLWLNDERDTPEGVEGNRKWDEFVRSSHWSEAHERVFYKMLTFRKEIDYMNADFQERFDDREKLCVEDICQMSGQLNQY
ncbi:uncharacterized protein LOC114535306 [Dendronephthya gigantea]|uniref:uncharacterized protein LOC114535306 n=1 Tax=Dendronephthya gigantea TaxID=151771 RepID=UPI00106CC103|nr:uncharacterized protein LOC114535306 [Dendronephthya gigantea]